MTVLSSPSDTAATSVSQSSRLQSLLGVSSLSAVAALIVGVSAGTPTAQAQSYNSGSSADALWQQCTVAAARSDAQALPVCLEGARAGHPRAMATVGKIYFEGEGVQHDPVQARYWCEKAAALGNRGAMFVLGRMYEEADGVPRDLHRAAAYYERSAQLGFSKAQFALGMSYEFGQGVVRSRQRAIEWLYKASDQGDQRAGWFGDWLKNPQTPRFSNPDQLAAYIRSNSGVHLAPSTGTRCPNVFVCEHDRAVDSWRSESQHAPWEKPPE